MATLKSIFELTTRPCWVDGRRAIFHRWSDNARPVKPRGMENDETVEHFQLHAVHAIVEYEDGTVGRVWPNMVQFADPERLFQEYDWEAMERQLDSELPFTYNGMDLVAAGVKITPNDCIKITKEEPARHCLTCAHGSDNQEFCEGAGYDCEKCTVIRCICKRCTDADQWEPKGGTNG